MGIMFSVFMLLILGNKKTHLYGWAELWWWHLLGSVDPEGLCLS
jgi:hypothetical protein